ncbi:MAG: hypothetical protein A2987_00270 [Omnitrophica bacterium RIFCSPLOWO2_01_FULL_45_10]|nr:MAG: hypothetical protein A2987_00270 [Omnitrophica bacterium RIFCSPLOWO2_01_FULL_45_10]
MYNKKQEDSLKERYFYKLSTNLAGLGIGAFIQAIIPRGLGPKTFGDFNFLITFFTQIINFFDMGSSTGFYAKVSHRPREFKLISFYFCFSAVAALIIISFVTLAQLMGLRNVLWPGQPLIYLYLALLLAVFVWISDIMAKIADAYGLTVPAEKAKIFQKLCALAALIVLFLCNKLSLIIFFLYNYCILALLVVMFWRIFKKNGYDVLRDWKITISEIKKYTAEFYAYSHPFFLFGLIAMIAGLLQRWLLQVFAGSVEQGFFGLSYQIGAISFMFTSAMTLLIMREFSIAYNNKDINLMARLFRKHVPLLYAITALIACFMAANADRITIMMGGGQFKGAVLAVGVMAFYPIHQVYGQLSGSVFYAADRTRLYCNIGILFFLLSIPITYLLIAPRKCFGLEAGALGLACQVVLIQFLAVNVQLYFNSRLLKFSFRKYLLHQLACVAVFFTIAIFSRLTTDRILIVSGVAVRFLLCGILYLIIAFIFIYLIPGVIGAKRSDYKFLSRGT